MRRSGRVSRADGDALTGVVGSPQRVKDCSCSMNSESKKPSELGYRMPAEWEPHAATWLSWPRREGISFPGSFDRVLPTLREMVGALTENRQSGSDPVCINVVNGAHEAEARAVLDSLPNQECITYYEIPTNEP